MTTKAIAKKEAAPKSSALLVLNEPSELELPEDLADLTSAMKENLGGEKMNAFDLDRVPIPAGGGTVWEVPGLGESEAVKELEGVIVHQQRTRIYFSKSIEESGGESRPDCVSFDAETGVGAPGGACETCALNAWGSKGDNSQGKACAERQILFVLRPGSSLPIVVSVPPSSLKAAKSYLMRLSQNRLRHWEVVTKLKLTKASNGEGVAYSQIEFSASAQLQGDARKAIASYVEQMRGALVQVAQKEASVAA